MRTKHPRSTSLVLILLLVSAGGCRLKGADAAEEIEEAPIYVRVETPVIKTVEEVIEVHGNLAAVMRADVVSEASGKIVELNVREGETVQAGQVLARIDDTDAKLSLRQSQSAYRVARADYLSTKELFEQGMKSKQEFDQKRRAYQDAATNLEIGQNRVKDTIVKSPISGKVIARKIELHRQVGAMEQLFIVADLSLYKIDITVTEAEVHKLQAGQKVRVRIDALAAGDEEFPFIGEVAVIQPMIDSQTGTVAVEVRLPNTDPRLTPGMFARLKIVTALHENAMVIPRKALVSEESNQLWVLEGDKARLIPVKTGIVAGEELEIVSGLSADSRVIVEGQAAITPKSKIAVVEPEPVSGDTPAPAPVPEPVPAGTANGE